MADEIKNTAAEMDWDSGISAEASESSFELPEVGEYGFTVEDFEKTISKSGKKMAKINIRLDENAHNYHIYDYLVLTTSMEWKLSQFFESLGLKKKGEPLTKMPWSEVLGAVGKCKIKHEIYEGETRCKVDRYLPTNATKAPTAPKSTPKDADISSDNMPFEV